MSQLNSRQRKFVAEYALTKNATQSAIAAGYSERTASVAGCRLLRHVHVAAALGEINARTAGTSVITREEIIHIWADMARAPLDPEKMQWSDKRGALDSLAKVMGMITDAKVSVGVSFGIHIHTEPKQEAIDVT